MTKIFLYPLLIFMLSSNTVLAAGSKAPAKKASAAKVAASEVDTKTSAKPKASNSEALLAKALQMVRSGQLEEGAALLYNLSRRSDLAGHQMQMKYILGNTLMQMKLNQVAAFQFVDVIKNGKSDYVKSAIEQLSIVADELGDDTLLNYAASKVRIDEFPNDKKDLITFRLAEVKLRTKQYNDAIALFGKIASSSRYYWSAQYKKGLAFAESSRPNEAAKVFQNIVNSRTNESATDNVKAIATMGMARAYYQAKDWDRAIEAYRSVPRDHELWHDSLFESSWALLMAGKLRSTLSQFQSLHSPFYLDSYNPESLILRGIVYLYICQYDEMEKTLDLFETTYGPVRQKMGDFISKTKDPLSYYAELERGWYARRGRVVNAKLTLPKNVVYKVLDESDVRRSFGYLTRLNEEKNRLDKMKIVNNNALGSMAKKILINRAKNAKLLMGEMMKNHMTNMRTALADFYEQESFLKYEMINGKKETLRKKIAGKDLPSSIDEKNDRSFYAQNGYEYWPFQGEYWLDEIGNYQYLGRSSCE